MGNVYTKQPSGRCPYCQDLQFGPEQERRPGQQLAQCGDCSQWSMRNEGTGVRFPLEDPTDCASTPAQTVTVD